MKHRLYVPELAATEQAAGHPSRTSFNLDGGQAHYLNRVLRLRAGAQLAVFDGAGSQWQAQLERSSPQACSIEILALDQQLPRPAPLILAQSWLKGRSLDTVLQKATELGATEFWLLAADRSNARPRDKQLENKLEHLRRVLVSAAEQCETLWLPSIRCYPNLAAVLEASAGLQRILLDLGQPPLDAGPAPHPLLLLVGPEGGWSDGERALAAGSEAVARMGLGSLTLRAETAPLAALAAIRHGWGWRR